MNRVRLFLFTFCGVPVINQVTVLFSPAEGRGVSFSPVWQCSLFSFAVMLVVLLIIIAVMYRIMKRSFSHKYFILEQVINKKAEDLRKEKEKTEALLANVLPKDTADELMARGKATKIKYNFVTVLFSDIQGFSQIAEEMNPEVLIDELDKFFFHFDSVVEKYRIEKIKTIGDAYMCAGGIPEKNSTNPVEVILAALEMQAYMKTMKESASVTGVNYWDIRIGIHTGTVVAGVVGHKKLSYDIWGDTVNTASRMESSGIAGEINISGITYEFAKDFFICEYRGKMPVKYKGELDMYFVKGIVPELCDETGSPNQKFLTRMQMLKLHDVEALINKKFTDSSQQGLHFHNASMHRNIINQAELLARAEQLPEDDYISLRIASIFLIPGYLDNYLNPAESSTVLINEILPGFGFTMKYRDEACRLISNSFANRYESLSDRILHDARYDYLGRIDFPELTGKLRIEMEEHGIVTDTRTWLNGQKRLLNEHDFLTESSRSMRSIMIEDQVRALLNNYK